MHFHAFNAEFSKKFKDKRGVLETKLNLTVYGNETGLNAHLMDRMNLFMVWPFLQSYKHIKRTETPPVLCFTLIVTYNF